MGRTTRHLFGYMLLAMTLMAAPAGAQIYKWVDADGNVHFGDKPKDPAQAGGAQPVELKESYQPPDNASQEQEAYEEEQRALRQRTEMHRQEDQKAKEVAAQERREEKAAKCAKYKEALEELESIKVREDGVRVLTYVTDENGNSVTSERQREIIADIRARSEKAGCA